MREILFRGKSTKTGKWIYGSLIELDNDHVFIVPRYESASTLSCIDLVRVTMEHVNPKTIGQYTGLDDRNGNKIFEGDFLGHIDYPDEEIPVVWYVNSFVLKGKWMNRDWPDKKHKIEVAGNIYDNPELLKK